MKELMLFLSFFLCTLAKANVMDTSLPARKPIQCLFIPDEDARKQPLYIVNGKPIEDSIACNFMVRLDVKLITCIEVLKDKRSTGLYCGRNNNRDTIIITTKQTDFSLKPSCKPPEYKNDNYTL